MIRAVLALVFFIAFPSLSFPWEFSGRRRDSGWRHHRSPAPSDYGEDSPRGYRLPREEATVRSRAKQATSALSFGQSVIVHRAGRDRYGRTVATVILMDGTILNYELVSQGWGWWYSKYAPDEIFLAILEAGARDAKKGLWVDPSPVPPWEWRKRSTEQR